MKALQILSILLFLSVANSLFFGIDKQIFCIQIPQQKGKQIKFFYEVTGETPDQTEVRIRSQNFIVVLTGEANSTTINSESPIQVCFVSTDGLYKSISIDYYTHDKAHLMELAKKSQIYELHSKLIDVGQSLKEITTNEQFEEQRQLIHSNIITGHEETIKNFAAIKLVAILLIAGLQIFLLKRILDKPRGYERV